MTSSDHCADCGKVVPIDRPVFRASKNRGVRCEQCELEADKQDKKKKEPTR